MKVEVDAMVSPFITLSVDVKLHLKKKEKNSESPAT